MSAAFVYSAYGLNIRAAFALWPWGAIEEPAAASEGISIELADPSVVFDALDFGPGRMEAVLDWPGVGSFWIGNGEKILVQPARGVTTEELALVTAGSALALLLEQRGCAVLHGSCVEIDGQGTALLGPSGAGKSTIAATLRDRGHRLISDGMTVVDLSGTEPLALPGPPHLKLWPDALRSLSGPESASRPLVRQVEKRWYDASRGMAVNSVPIRRVFLLSAGTGVSSEPLSPAAGLVGLVKNYLADFVDATAREFVLRRCSALAEAVSVSTLRRGEGLDDLSAVIVEVCGRA